LGRARLAGFDGGGEACDGRFASLREEGAVGNGEEDAGEKNP